MPRLGGDKPERRKILFDRREHNTFVRWLQGWTLMPMKRALHKLSGGRIQVRAGDH